MKKIVHPRGLGLTRITTKIAIGEMTIDDRTLQMNSDLLRDMRKEMDELRNAMREKTDWNLDGMVRMTDLPFTAKVLECPWSLKFCLPQLESFDGLKDPLDHIITFKTTLSLQQPLD